MDSNSMLKSVSFLLGAGFSVSAGYPIGDELNSKLINFSSLEMEISTDGKLYCNKGKRGASTFGNPYSVYLNCCINFIKEYSKNCHFDYENFFEFIAKKDYLNDIKYLNILNLHTTDIVSLDSITSNIGTVYNLMISHLLKDENNQSWYDNIPNQIGSIPGYDGFLRLLKIWKEDYIINIHTLNHDMLLESFNRTDYISGEICDGFEELGSEYYGILRTMNNRTYHVRLEKFTGNYNRKIRLYKLHGSLDYVLYYKTDNDGSLVPCQYVKTRYGVGYDGILRDTYTSKGYERYPFAYHANFLTGTTSKIKNYEDPLLFKILFESFINNISNSEILIIIGYGCKDKGINDIILNNFKGQKVYLVDPYCEKNDNIIEFGKRLNATFIAKELSGITVEDFT